MSRTKVRFVLAMCILSLLVIVAACSANKRFLPATLTAQPFSALDSAMRGTAPPVAANVTADRIRAARSEPQNWLTYYGAYDGQRYTTLDQINTSNIKNLKPAWVFQSAPAGLQATPVTWAFEAAPIVVDGVMYLSGWDGQVWALDAAEGTVLWKYQHAVSIDTPLCCGNVNRGVAVASGKVFFATPTGHAVALDARTGKEAWDVPFGDIRAGESATVAPLIVKNTVIFGSSGGEYGVRGHIDAFRIDTGRRAWRLYTIPKPGEPGGNTWEGASAWERGGGTAWITGTYDPDLNLLYWGVGNPGPDFDGEKRGGTNLYTSSVIAVNPDSGTIKWHYQWTPHDVWDYDGVNENILFDRGAEKLLAHFDKNGYLFILNRETGKFVRAIPFGRVTWGTIDSGTGRVTPRLKPTQQAIEICPGPAGLKEWPHAAYSPRTGFLYTPTVNTCAKFKTKSGDFKESLPYWGGEVMLSKEQTGSVKAFDPETGKEMWSWSSRYPVLSSALATASDILFIGEADGNFDAFNARTGAQLWKFNTGSGIHSSPVSYSVNGKQYVAVASGWGGWVKGFSPELYGGQKGAALFVFALP